MHFKLAGVYHLDHERRTTQDHMHVGLLVAINNNNLLQ